MYTSVIVLCFQHTPNRKLEKPSSLFEGCSQTQCYKQAPGGVCSDCCAESKRTVPGLLDKVVDVHMQRKARRNNLVYVKSCCVKSL